MHFKIAHFSPAKCVWLVNLVNHLWRTWHSIWSDIHKYSFVNIANDPWNVTFYFHLSAVDVIQCHCEMWVREGDGLVGAILRMQLNPNHVYVTFESFQWISFAFYSFTLNLIQLFCIRSIRIYIIQLEMGHMRGSLLAFQWQKSLFSRVINFTSESVERSIYKIDHSLHPRPPKFRHHFN